MSGADEAPDLCGAQISQIGTAAIPIGIRLTAEHNGGYLRGDVDQR